MPAENSQPGFKKPQELRIRNFKLTFCCFRDEAFPFGFKEYKR